MEQVVNSELCGLSRWKLIFTHGYIGWKCGNFLSGSFVWRACWSRDTREPETCDKESHC